MGYAALTSLLPAEPAETLHGWRAAIDLGFVAGETRTTMQWCRHEGPLRVQRPFYPERDGTCHVYLLHPPGGVVGGDELNVQAQVGERAAVLVTTPGATKIYRCSGVPSRIYQELHVAAGARLEWLPQETIAFASAEVTTTTVVRLEPQGSFVGWEILCLGRPVAGEDFLVGSVTQRFEVWQDDIPLYCERLALRGGDAVMDAPWGLGCHRVVATLVIAIPHANVLATIRHELDAKWQGNPLLGGTELEGATIFRFLGRNSGEARAALGAVWRVVRRLWGGDSGLAPRIWNT